jgi:hypothetical protein
MLTANSARTASTAAYPWTSPFSTPEPTRPQADRYALVATRSVCQSGSFWADREVTQQLFDSAADGFVAFGFTYPAASRRVVDELLLDGQPPACTQRTITPRVAHSPSGLMPKNFPGIVKSSLPRNDNHDLPCRWGACTWRRAMDEQVEHVEQVVEELPEYALMVDLPD